MTKEELDEKIKQDKEFIAYWNHESNCEPESGAGLFELCDPDEVRCVYSGWDGRKKFEQMKLTEQYKHFISSLG